MRRVGSVLLALLAGILMPVLIWVALFAAIRQPLLRAVRRVGSVLLALLAGILWPVIAWVALFATIRLMLLQWREKRAAKRAALEPTPIRQRRFGALRKVAPVVAALLAGVLMPVLIWVAAFFTLSALYQRWRESQLPSSIVCRIDSDCPPGYMCLAGRCVPQY